MHIAKSLVAITFALAAGCGGTTSSEQGNTTGSHAVVESRTETKGSAGATEHSCDGTCEHRSKDAELTSAKSMMEGKDYEGAISVLADKTAAEPDNAQAWHLYGYALHAAGRLDEALSVHQKAATFDETRAVALYNVACVHALKGDAGASFAALDQALAAGFSGVEHLESDSDLASIRSDRRFSAVVEAARANPAPKKHSHHGH